MGSRKILTIEIGHKNIRICEMNYRNQKKPMIYRALSVDTPANSILDGYINEPRDLGEYLKEKLEEAGIKNRDVVFTIASNKVMSREVEIPLVKNDMISKIVQAQANEYMPIDIGDCIVSHTVLEKDKATKKIKLMVFAVPKDLVDDYYKLAEAMGVKVESVDYVGNSEYQWLKHVVKEQSGLIVNIGDASTMVTVLDNGKLMLQRTIATGMDLLLQKETFAGAVSFEADEGEPKEVEDNQQISGEELELLVGSLSRIIEYHTNSKKGNSIEKIYISGEGIALPDIDTLMGREFDITVGMIRNCNNQASCYINCAGAALAPIDLIPYELADHEQKNYDLKTYMVMLGVVAATCVFVIGVCQLQYFSLQSQNKQIQKEIEHKQYIVKIYDKYLKEQKQYDYLENLDLATERNNENLSVLFKDLEDTLPAGAEIVSLSSVGDSFSISFAAQNKKIAANTVSGLKGLEYVDKVYVAGLTEKVADGIPVEFQVTCNYAKGGGK